MLGAITIDVDTLPSLFKKVGYDYDYSDFTDGLNNFDSFLTRHNIKATIFVVGKDLEQAKNRAIIKRLSKKGHEIANHSYNHIQGFSNLSYEKKEIEIKLTEEIIKETTGKRPRGFRAPGWNIDDETLDILEKRGYLYDSSIFPSFFNPIMKLLNYINTQSVSKSERTSLGKMSNMFSSKDPHRIRKKLVEIPIAVTPLLRIPFFGTFTHMTGKEVFTQSLRSLKSFGKFINYEFHLIEFVNFKGKLQKHLPNKGVYVPPTAKIPINKKNLVSEAIFSSLIKNCKIITLEEVAKI